MVVIGPVPGRALSTVVAIGCLNILVAVLFMFLSASCTSDIVAVCQDGGRGYQLLAINRVSC